MQADFKLSVDTLLQNGNNSRFEEATINAYDDKANLLYRLTSPVILYLQDNGLEFEKPLFIYQTPDATPLNLSANKGHINNDSALIDLLGDVAIYRINQQTNMPEYLYTSDATIDLDKKTAYTDAKATFQQHNKVTEGMGMIADLEKQTIRLLSNIKVLNTR